jgi:Tfp pilus assembly protein PilZ
LVIEERPLFIVGFADDSARQVEEAAASVGVHSACVPRVDELPNALQEAQPIAIVLRIDAPGAGAACTHVRCQLRLSQVPIFGVAPERNDLAFTELFVWGGDDLVGLGPDPLARRLRVLRAHGGSVREPKAFAGSASSSSKDLAVVAGPDASWRTVMGRALYNGGFAVRFAATADGLVEECVKEGARVVVAADDLGPDGALSALGAAREKNSTAAWVISAAPKRMAAVHEAMRSLGKGSVVDGFAPPENALFVVNELLAARGVDKRSSARLLYGTAVAFRGAGRDEDEIGFSYNINAGGVYVRTLSPLDAGQEVWLEMWPPRTERRVRLAGRVAWRRLFGPVGGATVPAGFGVQISDGLAGDLDRWRTGYAAYAESMLGLH